MRTPCVSVLSMLEVEFAQLSDSGTIRPRNEDYLGHVLPSSPKRFDPAGGCLPWRTEWVASGGRGSRFFSRPTWQVGLGVPAGTRRLVPDVCTAADPNTGALLVRGGRTIGLGGTSWSARSGPDFALLSMKHVNDQERPLWGFSIRLCTS
jgi:hypothetical protein